MQKKTVWVLVKVGLSLMTKPLKGRILQENRHVTEYSNKLTMKITSNNLLLGGKLQSRMVRFCFSNKKPRRNKVLVQQKRLFVTQHVAWKRIINTGSFHKNEKRGQVKNKKIKTKNSPVYQWDDKKVATIPESHKGLSLEKYLQNSGTGHIQYHLSIQKITI